MRLIAERGRWWANRGVGQRGAGCGHWQCSASVVRRAFSLVELLISLAITAMLLTATMVAIDTSFKSYATAAELAGTQASSRLVTHRLVQLIRTSTAHGPLLPNASADPPITLTGQTIESRHMELLDPDGRIVRIEYRSEPQELWIVIYSGTTVMLEQPLLTGVTEARFFGHRRLDREGLWVLERGSVDLTILPGGDTTLDTERGRNAPIRVIASTMPRKLD